MTRRHINLATYELGAIHALTASVAVTPVRCLCEQPWIQFAGTSDPYIYVDPTDYMMCDLVEQA